MDYFWTMNGSDAYDLQASRVLDIRKEMLMLHSGHKSGHLDFILDLFYGICHYFFYYYYVFFYFA